MSSNSRYPTVPRVAIGVVCWKGDDVLLIKRAKPPRAGTWSIPGGKQELGETIQETALRELMEETGIKAKLRGFITALDSITKDDAGAVEYHYTLIDLSADYVSGEPVASSDVSDARWVPFADLGDYGLWDETIRIIEMSRNGKGDTL